MRHDSATMAATAPGSRANSAGTLLRDLVEERRVGDHTVLDDLVQPGAEFAPRQRREHVGIGDHQLWRMECADQILAERVVDAHLAADRAVDLRHQRGRDLHEPQATQKRGGSKTDHVADDAAPDRDDRCPAIGVALHERIVDAPDRCRGLEAFAVGHENRLTVRRGATDRVAVQLPHERTRHDDPARPDPGRIEERRQRRERAGADEDRITAGRGGDVDASGRRAAARGGRHAIKGRVG